MKALLVLSGGYDSQTVLRLCTLLGYDVHILFFDYGQKAVNAERECLSTAVNRYCNVGFRYSDIVTELKIPLNWALSYEKTNYFPWRNLVLMSYALSYAEARGYEMIVTGINASELGYPDTKPEFLKEFESMCKMVNIKLWTPLQELYKGDVFELGTQLGVKLEDTWWCDYSDKLPCGKCGSCKDVQRGIEGGYLPKEGTIKYTTDPLSE